MFAVRITHVRVRCCVRCSKLNVFAFCSHCVRCSLFAQCCVRVAVRSWSFVRTVFAFAFAVGVLFAFAFTAGRVWWLTWLGWLRWLVENTCWLGWLGLPGWHLIILPELVGLAGVACREGCSHKINWIGMEICSQELNGCSHCVCVRVRRLNVCSRCVRVRVRICATFAFAFALDEMVFASNRCSR